MVHKLFPALCMLLCLLFCTAAHADWTCAQTRLDGTTCGQVNTDGSRWCADCGFAEPVHDLRAAKTGTNFILLTWYGTQEKPMLLFWSVSGEGSWQAVENITGSSCLMNGLRPGTAYDFELSTESGEILGKTTQSTVNDSTEQAEPTSEPAVASCSIAVGDYLTFGHYPQTRKGNDNTPIEWLVLDVDSVGHRVLVISRYGLDAMPYNKKQTAVTWENCSLRDWLNGDFLDRAFTGAEQDAILMTAVDNGMEQGISGGAPSGNDTLDRLFLLSFREAGQYFGAESSDISGAYLNTRPRTCPTAYAISHGAYHSDTAGDPGDRDQTAEGEYSCWWWLRSPGYDPDGVSYVCTDGSMYRNTVSRASGSVRPAMWIDLDAWSF